MPVPRAEGFTATTDVPLYWREDGPSGAPPVVVLHGGPGAHHDYLYPQMLALAATHRVITYDQRGGGRSRTDDPVPITWHTQVDDLSMVLREFGLESPAIVGYSWGALLAMLYAIQGLTRHTMPPLGRMALISPAPITRDWRDQFEAELLARQRGPVIHQLRAELSASGLRETNMAAYRQRSFELSVAGYFANPRLAESLTAFRVTGRVQASIWESLGDFDLTSELRAVSRAVRRPVLVVHGRNDPIPLVSAEAVAAALDGQLVVLDDCGHVPYVEQPRKLFDAMLRFLS
ncbi:MAG: alpha/beta hydrolase [Gemmatimonadaceae bacterium]|nr:alpha/beta hydrolase [Gemmatimonadaceae bacterium]